jgi:xanthine dehydrogenase accessory factor
VTDFRFGVATMFSMSDHAAILRAFDHARAGALPAVLATVVGTRGSTYRKPGARMILVGDGTRVGVVSGGCLEADVARRAWFLKSPGEAELVRYDTGTGEDATYEFGLGCRGVVEVLLERLDTSSDPPIVRALRTAVADRRTSRLATFIRGPRIGQRADVDGCRCDGAADEDAVLEIVAPPVQLIVFGSGIDVAPVIRIANAVGWQTLVVDHRLQVANVADAQRTLPAKGPVWTANAIIDVRTAAIVMTHRMDDDAAYLGSLVGTAVAYVGCLGPASRTTAIFDQLAVDGVAEDAAFRAKVHAPVGLDLGGERPEEIALAIVAEVQAALNERPAGRLSDRDGPIHAADASPAVSIG